MNEELTRPSLSVAMRRVEIEDEIAQAVTSIIENHQSSHGDFDANARVSQAIKHALHSGPNWEDLPFKQREALEQIAVKIARIVCGDPRFKDHWLDGMGYFKLGGSGL